ncbi:hypothetical protein [Gorillibacterium sp. CAU 1737]|uniref:hypothetical protein n=1 Tax=Gorillibacterium sp. CAU 1737 TaxID=3140362 RepID=UPI0032600E2E
MKRGLILICCVAFLLAPHQLASAKWASSFVVYAGDLYEVLDEPVSIQEINQKIGEVTRYSTHEGTYSGNFSNVYPKGTPYYSMHKRDPKEAIAVQVKENAYLLAINQGHYDNDRLEIPTPTAIVILIGVFLVLVLLFRGRKKSWRYR